MKGADVLFVSIMLYFAFLNGLNYSSRFYRNLFDR